LLRVKRFVDAEAVVVRVEEQMHNGNEEKTPSGRRSSKKAGKVATGSLGMFVCRSLDDTEFGVGPGALTHAERRELWERRSTLPGKVIKFKYQKVGVLVKPRLPTFLGFRDKGDM
jgi:hypothetical protein